MKETINPMHKLCGAKSRTNNNLPCRNYTMKNGRCRMHGGSSTGPKTNQGKKSIAQARTTNGLRTKDMLAEKKKYREIVRDTDSILAGVQTRIDRWRRMEAGDEDAICELTKEAFGEAPRDC